MNYSLLGLSPRTPPYGPRRTRVGLRQNLGGRRGGREGIRVRIKGTEAGPGPRRAGSVGLLPGTAGEGSLQTGFVEAAGPCVGACPRGTGSSARGNQSRGNLDNQPTPIRTGLAPSAWRPVCWEPGGDAMGLPEELPSPSLHSSLCALDLAPDHRFPGPRSRGLRGRRMPRLPLLPVCPEPQTDVAPGSADQKK